MASSTTLPATTLNPSASEDTSKATPQAGSQADTPSDQPIPQVAFSSPRLAFRPLHPIDAQAMSTQANNPKVTQYLRDSFPYPYTLEDANYWISHCQSLPPRTPALGIFYNPPPVSQTTENTLPASALRVLAPTTVNGSREATSPQDKKNTTWENGEPLPGQYLGGIGLTPRQDMESGTSELGYWVGEQWWGRGFATEAAAAFCAWSFRTDALLRRIEALVAHPNKASCRALEKVGFEFEGCKRQAVAKKGVVMDLLVYGLLRDDAEDGVGGFLIEERERVNED